MRVSTPFLLVSVNTSTGVPSGAVPKGARQTLSACTVLAAAAAATFVESAFALASALVRLHASAAREDAKRKAPRSGRRATIIDRPRGAGMRECDTSVPGTGAWH